MEKPSVAENRENYDPSWDFRAPGETAPKKIPSFLLAIAWYDPSGHYSYGEYANHSAVPLRDLPNAMAT